MCSLLFIDSPFPVLPLQNHVTLLCLGAYKEVVANVESTRHHQAARVLGLWSSLNSST